MIVVNTDFITGKEIETIGVVKGATVRSKHIGKDIANAFKSIIGGELESYTKMMDEARIEAVSRMIEDAEKLGANGIINVRYTSSSIIQGAAEVVVYGTAVKVQ